MKRLHRYALFLVPAGIVMAAVGAAEHDWLLVVFGVGCALYAVFAVVFVGRLDWAATQPADPVKEPGPDEG
ncbi:hypothetical protein ACH46L_31735 [Streptomyces althioticus]|uniref:hypothetical protein n=1 Tax=Streptomyces althioticus TaxID=83380 RepID=UPI0037BB4149